jgi:GTP-binding protein
MMSEAINAKLAEEAAALESRIEEDLATIKMNDPTKFRNIAIIAHVDHGKTTLVDCMLKQAGVSFSNERAMDSNELEQERGITILSKCTGISYNGYKINIVDTPGHQDFGGEVERIMNMVDGVILVVCAAEGPMPQTRYVLKKALARGLKPVVVINKVDRESARIVEVENDVLDLFCSLNATEEQLDYPLLFASARNGWAIKNMNEPKTSVKDLFQAIVDRVPQPVVDLEKEFSMLVSQTESNQFFGKMLIGRIGSGRLSVGDRICAVDQKGAKIEVNKVYKIIRRFGVHQIELQTAVAGDIVSIAGFEKATVTSTMNAPTHTTVIPSVPIDPPMISMTIKPNDSPYHGKEGDKFTFLQLKERLLRECENDVSLKVEFDPKQKDSIFVFGRGDLHLGILVEKMRREGYELALTPPQVIYKTENGKKMEPIEEVVVEVDTDHVNLLLDSIQNRKGIMIGSDPLNDNKSKVTFEAPSRGLFGFRPFMIALTKGHVVIVSKLKGYEEFKGPIKKSSRGAILSCHQGKTTTFAMKDVEAHGNLFISPGSDVYAGMVIGELNKEGEVEVNPCREKPCTNIRTVSKEENIKLAPPKVVSLEDCMVSLRPDELLEVTPKNIRIRKKILDSSARRKVKRERRDEEC